MFPYLEKRRTSEKHWSTEAPKVPSTLVAYMFQQQPQTNVSPYWRERLVFVGDFCCGVVFPLLVRSQQSNLRDGVFNLRAFQCERVKRTVTSQWKHWDGCQATPEKLFFDSVVFFLYLLVFSNVLNILLGRLITWSVTWEDCR